MKNKRCKPDSERICGTSIELGDITFSGESPNLVYLDKVFSFNNATSCPLLSCVNTHKKDFTVMFETENRICGCECDTCEINENSEFIIEKATATLDFIGTMPPGNISPSQVTIDGEPVDSVTFENNRFKVGAADIFASGQKQQCLELGLPTRCFFLVREVGPWQFRATYVLEGLVNSNGKTCRFRAVFSNEDGSFSVIQNNCANFAIPDMACPCTVNGVTPDLTFQFGGTIKMVNPKLRVQCSRKHQQHHPNAEGFDEACMTCHPISCQPMPCRLTLCSNLIITPSIQVEVVRKTLFSICAKEALIPCDQEVAGIEEDMEEHDCHRPCRPSECINVCCNEIQDDICGNNRSRLFDTFRCNNNNNSNNNNSNNHRNCRSPRTAFQFHGSNGCSW